MTFLRDRCVPGPVLGMSFYLLLAAVCGGPIIERRKMRAEVGHDLPKLVAVGGEALAQTSVCETSRPSACGTMSHTSHVTQGP